MNNRVEKPKKRTEKERAQDLLNRAAEILDEVSEGSIFKKVARREFPTFQRSELGFSKVLGVGGFCVVKEIRGIRLTSEKESKGEEAETTPGAIEGGDDDDADDEHLEVSTAREFMANHCLRNGDARYAVKRLNNKSLSELEEARGIIDLAIEARFLTVLSHPNIVKMRALAQGDPIREDYFIVMDRLYGTLEDRMNEWRNEKKKYTGFMKFGNKPELEHLLVDRMTVAYDLSSAFRYMHSHKLAYRDIKPDNIGFDIRGDVKVFDFGLCKSLLAKHKDKNGMYKLTARTGSKPYMAPEVYLCKPYNSSADVFSFAVLLWEILSLKEPFAGLTRAEFAERVMKGNYRPRVSSSWPVLTRKMIAESWSEKPGDRPNFQRISGILRGDLIALDKDNDQILHRTAHMMNRSNRSQRGLFLGRGRSRTSSST